MAATSKDAQPDPRDEPEAVDGPTAAGPLVPFGGPRAIVPGVQAFRRGDVILYTVRGEPREVLELMGHLQHEDVGEVVALISHQAPLENDEVEGDEHPDESEDEDH